MGLTERISIIIDSVHDGAVRGLNSVGAAATNVTPKTRSANAALGLLNRTGLGSTQMGQRLTAGINQTGTAMGGLRASGVSAGQALGVGVAGGAAAAGAALASLAIKGIAKFEDATAQVRGLQRVMGGTAEDASKLRFVGEALGISTEKVGKGMGLMAKAVGLNKSKLGEYGIEVVKGKDGNTDFSATLLNVAHAYQATDDPAAKAAIRFAAFGKGGNDLIPILGKTDEELKALYATADEQHQIFDDQQLEDGRRLSFATRELDSAVTGLEIELAGGLVPALADATEGITDVLQSADEAAQPLGGLGDVFGYVADTVTGPVIHGVKTFTELFQGHFTNSIKEGVHSIPAVGPAINSLTGWLDTGSDSSEKAADAAQRHAEKEGVRADAMKVTADAATQAEESIQGLVDIGLAYETSIRQLGKATDDYNVALWESIEAGGADTEANKKLNDATFALKGQLNETAKAAAQHAVATSFVTDKTALAKLGNDTYRASLMQSATSAIPAVRAQAFALIAALDEASHPRNIKVTLDTYEAHNALNGLRTKWDSLQNAMGQIGPSRD